MIIYLYFSKFALFLKVEDLPEFIKKCENSEKEEAKILQSFISIDNPPSTAEEEQKNFENVPDDSFKLLKSKNLKVLRLKIRNQVIKTFHLPNTITVLRLHCIIKKLLKFFEESNSEDLKGRSKQHKLIK